MKMSKVGNFLVRIVIVLGVCACLLWTSNAPVQADMAPPSQPPGSNPLPGNQQTQVQMLAETVVITVQSSPYWIKSAQSGIVNDWANVQASFTMHNQGTADETMQVQFPLENPNGMGDGYSNYPLIQNFTVQANGAPLNTTRMTTPNPMGADNPAVHWATFPATFPAGQDVHFVVSYALGATGYIPTDRFEYILETGAGWYGPIGSADLSLVLPYPAGPDNIIVDDSAAFKGIFSGNKVTWHYDNLEPTSNDNLEIAMIQPGVWNEAVAAQAAVASQPNSSEAWGSLGRAYKHALSGDKGFMRQDDGGKKLFALADQAYQKAISIAPNVAKWHAGFAELLWLASYPSYQFEANYLTQALQEIQRALQLDPANQQARTLADNMGGSIPGLIATKGTGYDFLALTATLTPEIYATSPAQDTPAPAETITPMPTKMSAPLPSQTARLRSTPPLSAAPATPAASAAQKTNKPLLPCCGSLLIFPLLAAWLWIIRRHLF
ncbi:MAG: hypothetical protein P4L50_16820 [Anaerolineaceae bacterium]|nr:hypothetical protein [Anaerolineaceae bacterium]